MHAYAWTPLKDDGTKMWPSVILLGCVYMHTLNAYSAVMLAHRCIDH